MALLDDDEIDLRELFAVLWAGRLKILAVTVTAALLSVVVALSLPNIYRAEALVVSSESDSSGGLSALAGQFGGLASLAGVSLGSGDSDRTQLGIEVLQSRQFFADFIARRDVLVPLMATAKWNSATGELVIDEDIYNTEQQRWVREVEPPRTRQPSVQEAYAEFVELFSVSQDKKSGMVTVAVEHQSPQVAQQWVSWLIDDLNTTLREQDIAEAERSITYLQQQVRETNVADLQTLFFGLIQKQTERVMLAKVRDQYLFKTIDPAVVPELKSKPKRALICLLGTLLGGMLALFWVLFDHYALNRQRQEGR
ncbi:LPS O-antigen length regulator [Gammaproteobacteria bacterium LSUCC0057]|uniref:LPS O-antigen length regulator n=1 Tax=Gammaproteobacteria bacterium LSUCC0057 TaxID=2559237 RepID=A0A4Y8UJT9_9GAMM|nr:LPS O-antigen length regulator [Gammaproteobacteria bacterium LSUCC0057]